MVANIGEVELIGADRNHLVGKILIYVKKSVDRDIENLGFSNPDAFIEKAEQLGISIVGYSVLANKEVGILVRFE